MDQRWWAIGLDRPGGCRLDHFLIRRRPVSVATAAHADDEVLMLWRHQVITDGWGWELPVGVLEDGESPEAAGACGMEEETGRRPGPLRHLLAVEPSNGLSDARHHVYWSREATCIGHAEDDFESTRRSWVPLARVPAFIAQGRVPAANMAGGLLMPHHLRLGRGGRARRGGAARRLQESISGSLGQ
ncbi:NUDIX domain-containing protein [Streptomyces sp. DW26H14]|uniref:NUDIX domain-containing protein n=1 Tax=Streptomyces sp. DW26H14 TaxID=3435395 RepID=UPI00403E1B58